MDPVLPRLRGAAIVLACAVPLALPACGRGRANSKADAATLKPVKARVVAVEQRKLRRDVETVGSLFAYEEVVVSSEVEGRVERVLADVGDRVSAGQPLVQVAPEELRLSLEQQRAIAQQVRARLGLADGVDDLKDLSEAAEVKRAAADRADAEQKYERARSLYEDGLIARGTFDEAEARFKSARAAHDLAHQAVENLRAELRQRRATLALAEKKLGDTVIRSPFGGQVKERLVAPGQFLRVQTPAMVVVDIDPLRLRLKVPEKVAAWVSVGQPVSVGVEAHPDHTFTGTVSRMSPSVDRETRTLEVEALLENKEGLLKPGFFAKARIASSQVTAVLMVPSDAVRYVFGVYKVYAVESGALHERDVKLGERTGADVEIVDGLTDKDQVALPLKGEEPREGARVEAVDGP